MTLPLHINEEEGAYLCPLCGEQLQVLIAAEHCAGALAPVEEDPDTDFATIVYDEDYWGGSGPMWQQIFCPSCGWAAKNYSEIVAAAAAAAWKETNCNA